MPRRPRPVIHLLGALLATTAAVSVTAALAAAIWSTGNIALAVTSVVTSSLASIALTIGRGRPEPVITPGRVELSATSTPNALIVAVSAVVALGGAVIAQANDLNGRQGTLLTFCLGAAALAAGRLSLRWRPRRISLTRHRLELIYADRCRRVALGPDSWWKKQTSSASVQVSDGGGALSVRASAWGPGDSDTLRVLVEALQSSGTPRAA